MAASRLFCFLHLLLLLLKTEGQSVDSLLQPPDYNRNRYEMKAEINDLNTNFTMEVDEWYDGNIPALRMIHRERNNIWDIISSTDPNVFFVMTEGRCQTQNLTTVINTRTPIALKGVAEEEFISPGFMLKWFANMSKINTIGSKEVRGVNANCWTAQADTTQGSVTYALNVTNCWSAGWSNPGTTGSVPLLLKVVSDDPGETVNIEVHYIFHRVNLTKGPEFFQTPQGVYCENRPKTDEIPKIPDTVRFSAEIVYAPSGKILNTEVQYDKSLNIVRFRYADPDSSPPYYPYGSLTMTHDFFSGVAYVVDDVIGNCSAVPIDGNAFDARSFPQRNRSPGTLSEIRSPNDIFRIDGNYSRVGKVRIRGLLTDYYIAKRTDVVPDVFNMTFELYFLDISQNERPVGPSIGVKFQVPVQLVASRYFEPNQTRTPEQEFKEIFNFYNFDSTDGYDEGQVSVTGTTPWNYDVRGCYKEKEIKHFRIVYIGSGAEMMRNETNIFISIAMNRLLQVAGVMSPLRLQEPELDFNDTYVFLTVSLLPTVDPKAQYLYLPGKKPNVTATNKSSSESTEDCLFHCSHATDMKNPCYSVSYNSETKQCDLFTEMYGEDMLITSDNSNYYTRTTKFIGAELNSDTILRQFINSSKGGLLQVNLPQPDSTIKVYKSVDFIDAYNRLPFKLTVYPTIGHFMEQFKEVTGYQVQSTHPIDGQMLADDCARLCLNDAGDPPCESFTYNFKVGQCLLSTYKMADEGRRTKSSECNAYFKNDLGRFEEYKLKSLRQIGSTKFYVVNSPDECASKCLKADNDNCRSFDYCADIPSYRCFLNDAHISDSGIQVDNTKDCSHYSRSYKLNFKQRFQVESISLDGFVVLDLTGDTECSKLCSDEYSAKCKGYFSCPVIDDVGNPESRCALVMDDKSEKNLRSGRDTCTYNERMTLANGSPYTSRVKVIGTAGMNPGGAAGLAIGMLLAGIVLTAVFIIFVLPRLQKRANLPDVGVYFNRNLDEAHTVPKG